MADAEFRQWSMDAERRIAAAVRAIEGLRRDIHGKRHGGGVTYPNFNRVAHVYGATAAGTDEAPVAGELKFARIDTDATTYVDQDDTPTTFYNIGPALDDGEPVVANLDIWGKYSDGQKAVWIVGGSEGGADVPSIKVGMGAAAISGNNFATTSFTYNIGWTNDETVNTDTSVFEQTGEDDPGVWYRIRCKVAGTYRVWYHTFFESLSTNTASEIQRGTTFVVKTASDGSGATTVPSSADAVELLHHDSDDQPVGIGTLNGKGKGESLYTMAANECFMMQFSFSSGTRGVTCGGEAWGVQLVKRG